METAAALSSSSPHNQDLQELRKKEEWQDKLSSLQDQHKNESLHQQQEHLEQLKRLQTQLLRELSSDMIVEGAVSVQDKQVTSPRNKDGREDEKENEFPSPEKHSITESQDIPSPTQSLDFFRLPRTNPVVQHSPVTSPPHKANSPPPIQTPPYKILGPSSAWEEGESRSPQVSWTSPRTPHSSSRGDTLSRASLLAKHTKHVEDLKKYYDSELQRLQQQLEHVRAVSLVGSPLRRSAPSSPAQRQLQFPSTDSLAKGPISNSQIWIVQSENERLKSSCLELQGRLDNSDREKHVLEGQLKRFQQHLTEWQERSESSERLVSVLQERLDSTRSQLHDQERLNGQLNSDLSLTTEELVFWKDQKLQDVEKLDQLFHEFEVLQEENQQLLSMTSDLKAQLEESGGQTAALRSSLDKYTILDSQYQSTIRRLEDELRRLEHVNNRLNGQATHYDTGWSSGPSTNQHRSHSPQRDHPLVHSHDTPSRPKSDRSPVPLKDKSIEADNGTPQGRPLTRRKWLESSIPGLLSGGTEMEEKPSPSNSRLPSRMSPERNVMKSVKFSPRRTQVDSVNTRERAPTRLNANDSSVEDALRAVRDGNVLTSGEGRRKSKKKSEQSLEERVQDQLERVGQAERRLVELQTERERLEGALQRTPARVTRETKQSQVELEWRLEQVLKEIGSERMVLRKHHAFNR